MCTQAGGGCIPHEAGGGGGGGFAGGTVWFRVCMVWVSTCLWDGGLSSL